MTDQGLDRGLAQQVGEVPAAAGWTPFPVELVGGTVHAAFERQVAAGADRLAVTSPSGRASYGELDAIAGHVAAQLVALGAHRRPVALAMAHDLDLVAAVFAVLKAGAVVLILDPVAPIDVNRAILEDAEPVALLFDGAGSEVADATSDIVVQRRWSELLADVGSGHGATGPHAGLAGAEVGPDDPAMLAYSSGTTGGAKAAVLPHRALLHLFRGAIDALKIGPEDRLPMIFPISLAVAAYPMFLPLVSGGSLRIRDVRSVGLVGFEEWLASEQVSVLYVSPTVVRFMGEPSEGIDRSHLRLVVLGGERVDDDAVAIVRRAFGDQATVANGYGTTETGVLTFFVTDPAVRYGAAGVPAGRPIAETTLAIVDDDGEPVVDGAVGELVVESRYLFSGYWKRPELTDAVLDESGPVPRYRTGDVGRVDSAGNLVLVGRSDAEVKVRGHRIVPGEVEQAMLALPEVLDAVVEARPDPRGTNELVAWVVPAAREDLASVRAATKRSVRGPMVPARISLLEALPQLPNGKLDRRALPDPDLARAPEGTVVEAASWMERRIQEIWEEILGTSPLSVDADLLALGAQSFDLAWALVQIEERIGVRVPMGELLEVRTIEELAVVAEDIRDADQPPPLLTEVQPGDADRPRLYFVHDLHGSAYSLRHLAPALGEDQPVWGFESPFLEGRGDGAGNLQELASKYVAAMRESSEGPYHLAGYSFGGVLAFEMAHQLRAAGAEVAFLGVVDVGPGYRGRHYDPKKMLDKPWSRIPMPPDGSLPVREQAAWYRDLARRSPRELAQHLALRTGVDRWTDPVQFRLDLRNRGRVRPEHRLWYAWRQHWELGRRYRWDGRFDGDLFLLWADESAATDGTMGWGDVIGGHVEIDHVDVPHERMLQPGEVVAVARPLRRALDRAISS